MTPCCVPACNSPLITVKGTADAGIPECCLPAMTNFSALTNQTFKKPDETDNSQQEPLILQERFHVITIWPLFEELMQITSEY